MELAHCPAGTLLSLPPGTPGIGFPTSPCHSGAMFADRSCHLSLSSVRRVMSGLHFLIPQVRHYHAVNKAYLKTVWMDGFIGSLKGLHSSLQEPHGLCHSCASSVLLSAVSI